MYFHVVLEQNYGGDLADGVLDEIPFSKTASNFSNSGLLLQYFALKLGFIC